MASWQYAFLFPGPNDSLQAASAVRVLADFGLEFDDSIRPAIEIDEFGHCEHGEETRVAEPIQDNIEKRLLNQEHFLVECRNNELFFSCVFATKYSNPFMMLGWSKRLFHELGDSRRRDYWDLLRRCAKKCRAAHVIIVNDPPDYFEDRFLEIDGQRIVENRLPSGNTYDIQAVWTDLESCDKIPLGVDRASCRRISDGFVEHTIPVSRPV